MKKYFVFAPVRRERRLKDGHFYFWNTIEWTNITRATNIIPTKYRYFTHSRTLPRNFSLIVESAYHHYTIEPEKNKKV